MGPWPLEDVERSLKLIQGFDPIGVAARDLQECLLLQLRHLGHGRDAGGEDRHRAHAAPAEPSGAGAGAQARDVDRRSQAAHRADSASRSEAGQPLQPVAVAVRDPRRLHRQGRGSVRGGAQRGRAAAAADQPGLPAPARQERGGEHRRDARLREGQVPLGAVADQVGRAAPEDDPQGRHRASSTSSATSSITGSSTSGRSCCATSPTTSACTNRRSAASSRTSTCTRRRACSR